MLPLAATDPDPVIVQNAGSRSPYLIICDHAGRRTPAAFGDLGVAAADWERHIAYDIGALGLAERLAEALGHACLIAQPYSRLVIDCNRAPDRADAIPVVSDGTAIPANRDLTPEGRQARVAGIHVPYHAAVSAELDARSVVGVQSALILVHSFTPVMAGVARPWRVGVLHQGNLLSLKALAWLQARPDLHAGDNEPYAMDDIDYTAPTHARRRGLEYLELETRQDLIAEESGQALYAELYAQMLREIAQRP